MLHDIEIRDKLASSRRWLVVTATVIVAATLAALLLGASRNDVAGLRAPVGATPPSLSAAA